MYSRAARTEWRWRWPILILFATVFFVPMGRYTFPVDLPIHLEPDRPLVALVVLGWSLSLLTMDARIRRTSLDVPMALLVAAVGSSLVANPERFSSYQPEALKFVSLFLTFVITYYLLASVVVRRQEIEYVVRLIVVFGAIVAVFATIEARTGFTPFTHLHSVLPILRELPAQLVTERSGRLRAFASAEHPIALGALLVMVTPFAVYVAVTTRRLFWWACTVALVIGALSTVSRTAVVMLVVVLAATALVRWHDIRRYWFMVFPILAVIHFASPGTLGAIKGAFRPPGGLVAEQSVFADSTTTGGRVTDLAPSLEEFEKRPLFGDGIGTRITVGDNINGRLLDNQWLGLLIDAGLAGTLAFLWLVIRFARDQFALARGLLGPPGYLPLACAASAIAYAVGMLTYDSFAFTQVTFAFFMVLALGVSLQLAVQEMPVHARTAPTPGRTAPVTASSLQPVQ